MNLKVCSLILTIGVFLSGCGSNNTSNSIDSTASTETAIATTEKQGVSVEDIYGYYESDDGCYFKITKNIYETKYNGNVLYSSKIKDIKLVELDKGKTQFLIYIKDNPDTPMIFLMNKEKKLSAENFDSFSPIDKDTYDNSVPTNDYDEEYNEYDYYEDEYYEDEYYEEELAWYEETFDMHIVKEQLQEIENLLATGKKKEANKLVDTYIFDKIQANVDEYIYTREYWVAQNYVAMYYVLIDERYYWYGCDFSFLNNYLDNEYICTDLVVNAENDFRGYLQKYYVQIAEAAISDNNYISKEECLYLINEVMIENGEELANGLLSDAERFSYLHGVYQNNSDDDYFYFVCPYSQNVYYIPYLYNFLEDLAISDQVMDYYFS